MNKSEQREVNKAKAWASIDPRTAAATLATLMRSCSKKTLSELIQVAEETKLIDHLAVVNGCYVAKGV